MLDLETPMRPDIALVVGPPPTLTRRRPSLFADAPQVDYMSYLEDEDEYEDYEPSPEELRLMVESQEPVNPYEYAPRDPEDFVLWHQCYKILERHPEYCGDRKLPFEIEALKAMHRKLRSFDACGKIFHDPVRPKTGTPGYHKHECNLWREGCPRARAAREQQFRDRLYRAIVNAEVDEEENSVICLLEGDEETICEQIGDKGKWPQKSEYFRVPRPDGTLTVFARLPACSPKGTVMHLEDAKNYDFASLILTAPHANTSGNLGRAPAPAPKEEDEDPDALGSQHVTIEERSYRFSAGGEKLAVCYQEAYEMTKDLAPELVDIPQGTELEQAMALFQASLQKAVDTREAALKKILIRENIRILDHIKHKRSYKISSIHWQGEHIDKIRERQLARISVIPQDEGED